MIDGLSVIGLSQSGLLAMVFLSVLTDRLVWRGRLVELRKQVEKKDELIAELTKQNSLLLESSVPTVNAVLTALHRAAEDEAAP